ncbi:MAG: hypothetical protein ACYC6D_08615 [Melioribacteraceae bacterium]
MKLKIILIIAFLYCFTPTIFSQSKFSLSAKLGIIQSYGTAEGVEIGVRRVINDNLGFQLTAGYYYWGKKQDLNAIYIPPSNYDTHIVRKMGLLIPVRVGFNYVFGNSNSHPYLSVEWAVNYITNDYYNPVFATDVVNSLDRFYIKSTKNTVFVSLGFNMGYSFCLSDDFNIVSGVNWQTSQFAQFVGFVSGIEYKL